MQQLGNLAYKTNEAFQTLCHCRLLIRNLLMMKDIYRLWDFFIPAMLFIFVVTDVASAQQIMNVPPAEFFSGDTIGTDTVCIPTA